MISRRTFPPATRQFGPLIQTDNMVSLMHTKWIWWWEKKPSISSHSLYMEDSDWRESQEWSLGTRALDTVGWETVFSGDVFAWRRRIPTNNIPATWCGLPKASERSLQTRERLHQMWPYLSGALVALIQCNEKKSRPTNADKVRVRLISSSKLPQKFSSWCLDVIFDTVRIPTVLLELQHRNSGQSLQPPTPIDIKRDRNEANPGWIPLCFGWRRQRHQNVQQFHSTAANFSRPDL